MTLKHFLMTSACLGIASGGIYITTTSSKAEETQVELTTKNTSKTDRYRVVWVLDPSTTATVAWDQQSGKPGTVYYDTKDHGTDVKKYAKKLSPQRVEKFDDMNNCFARLSDLKPDTEYFFVIQDEAGTSRRLKFRTAPNTPKAYTYIAGGDSRNFRKPRVWANQICAKLKPLFISFTGDMINRDTPKEWQEWLDDWQHTIASDGTIIPIVPHRGNHERRGNHVVYNLFDTTPTNYYAFSVGGDMSRYYVLNSELTQGGTQAEWLDRDLAKHSSKVTHLMAGYHKPMRPHVARKSEGTKIYEAWAGVFYKHGVDLVLESDSHVMKRTAPLKPSTSGDEGFVKAEDDPRATVYIGEGCWGAPLRKADDAKSWTLDCGSFNGVDWIQVTPDKINVYTIHVENPHNVKEAKESNTFKVPTNLNIWDAKGGKLLSIKADKLAPAK